MPTIELRPTTGVIRYLTANTFSTFGTPPEWADNTDISGASLGFSSAPGQGGGMIATLETLVLPAGATVVDVTATVRASITDASVMGNLTLALSDAPTSADYLIDFTDDPTAANFWFDLTSTSLTDYALNHRHDGGPSGASPPAVLAGYLAAGGVRVNIKPLGVASMTVTEVAVIVTYTTAAVTRLYPRDDGRGISNSPRIYPASKARRIVGGYQ